MNTIDNEVIILIARNRYSHSIGIKFIFIFKYYCLRVDIFAKFLR